jgi:hypothetical protein
VIAERWIGSLRRKLVDRVLILNRRQLEHVLTVFVDHYNTTGRTASSDPRTISTRRTNSHAAAPDDLVVRRRRRLVAWYTRPQVA